MTRLLPTYKVWVLFTVYTKTKRSGLDERSRYPHHNSSYLKYVTNIEYMFQKLKTEKV